MSVDLEAGVVVARGAGGGKMVYFVVMRVCFVSGCQRRGGVDGEYGAQLWGGRRGVIEIVQASFGPWESKAFCML